MSAKRDHWGVRSIDTEMPAGWFRVSDQLGDMDKRVRSSLPTVPVVYFVVAGDAGPIKIGFASNLRRRLHGLQTSHHEILKVLGWIEPGSRETERTLHIDLWKHHIRGDWFRSCEEVWTVVGRHARKDDF